jgi:hypothetical protein
MEFKKPVKRTGSYFIEIGRPRLPPQRTSHARNNYRT